MILHRYVQLLIIALVCAFLGAGGAAAQSTRFQGQLIGSRGLPLANQNVAVCTQPAVTTTQPCSPLATLSTSLITTSGGANPFTTDSLGNFFFYAVPGTYTLQFYGPQVGTPYVQPDMTVGAGGAGAFTTITVSGPLNTKILESTNFYADQFCGGSLDVGLCINNTLAAMPTVGSYKYGTIRLDGFAPGSAWVWNTLVTISSPGVSIRNETGTLLQITASVLTGDHLRINTSPFIVSLAGNFGGFALVGGSQANAVCIHLGDIIGAKLIDVRCSNFTGTGAVGLWIDNVTNFTERLVLDKVHMDGNTKGVRFTNTGNVAGTASFGHHRWYSLWVNVGTNQTGISYESGTLYSGTFNITENLNATTSTAFSISGLAYSGGPSTAWTGSLVNLNAETSAGSGTLFNVATGSSVLIGGVVTTGGGLTNTGAGTLSIYPGNAITNADFSNSTFAAGVLVIGGSPTATNIPQFNANSASVIAGVTASNYFLLRAGVAGLEAHDTSGNVGLLGDIASVNVRLGASGVIKNQAATATMGLTLKKGSGAGNYTNATTSYTVADSTNLCFTVTIPTGWKLGVSASGALATATAAVVAQAALTDNAACATANAGILVETAPIQGAGIGIADAFALNWVIAGDGAAHNIAMQFKTSNVADTASLINSSATIIPTMKFELMPSN